MPCTHTLSLSLSTHTHTHFFKAWNSIIYSMSQELSHKPPATLSLVEPENFSWVSKHMRPLPMHSLALSPGPSRVGMRLMSAIELRITFCCVITSILVNPPIISPPRIGDKVEIRWKRLASPMGSWQVNYLTGARRDVVGALHHTVYDYIDRCEYILKALTCSMANDNISVHTACMPLYRVHNKHTLTPCHIIIVCTHTIALVRLRLESLDRQWWYSIGAHHGISHDHKSCIEDQQFLFITHIIAWNSAQDLSPASSHIP